MIEARINPKLKTESVSLTNVAIEREWKQIPESEVPYAQTLRLGFNPDSPLLLEFRTVAEAPPMASAPPATDTTPEGSTEPMATVAVTIDSGELANMLRDAQHPPPEGDEDHDDDAPESEKTPDADPKTEAHKPTKGERRAAAKAAAKAAKEAAPAPATETPEGSTEPTK